MEQRHSPGSQPRWVERAAALTGAASFALLLAGVTLTDTGGRGASPEMSGEQLAVVMATYLPQWRVGAVLLIAAAALHLVFAAVLWDRLRVGQPAQWPAALALGGGIVAAVLITDAAGTALAQLTAGDVGDPTTSRVLVTTDWEGAWTFLVASLSTVTGAAVAGLRGALPRWLAMLSLLVAVVLVAALAVPGLPVGMLAVASAAWAVPASAVLAWQVGGRSAPGLGARI